MTWLKAVLAKRSTDDGLMRVEDDVAIGTEYEVDPATIREATFFNTEVGVSHVKRIVMARGGKTGTAGIMALDLLEVRDA